MAKLPTQTTNEVDLQIKEFLSRAEVRTMRKDLQKLREGVALKERERVVNIKTPEEEKIEKARLEKVEQNQVQQQMQQRSEILHYQDAKESDAMEQVKTYAKEDEKQKLFYLENEKLNLSKQLQTLQKEKEPPFLLQKNKFLIEKKEIETRLARLIEEEKGIEAEEKMDIELERTTTAPAEKQNLEKQRWGVERKREDIEKRRWEIEKELERSQAAAKIVDQEYDTVLAQDKDLSEKLSANTEALKQIYASIIMRVEEEKRLQREHGSVEALKRAELESKRKEDTQRQQWTGKDVQKQRFIQGQSDAKKEAIAKKLNETLPKEEDDRAKFLKNVEKWAEEEDKRQTQNPK